MQCTPAVADEPSPVANRGCLSRKQWADVRAAARTARDYGVQLTVHGVTVTAATTFGQQCPPDDATTSVLRRQAETAARRPTIRADDLPSRPSKRQRRSSQRLIEFQAKKRASLLAASSRVRTFCRQFRWNRMQQVWIGWKLQQQPQQSQKQQQQPQLKQQSPATRPTQPQPAPAASVWRGWRKAPPRSPPTSQLEAQPPRRQLSKQLTDSIKDTFARGTHAPHFRSVLCEPWTYRAVHRERTRHMLREELPKVRWHGLPLALRAEGRV